MFPVRIDMPGPGFDSKGNPTWYSHYVREMELPFPPFEGLTFRVEAPDGSERDDIFFTVESMEFNISQGRLKLHCEEIEAYSTNRAVTIEDAEDAKTYFEMMGFREDDSRPAPAKELIGVFTATPN